MYEAIKTEVTTFSVNNATFTYFKIGNINILNCQAPTVVGSYLTFNLGNNIRAPRDNVTFIMWQNTTGSGGTAYNNNSQTMCLAQILTDKTMRVYGASGLGGAETPYQNVLGCAIWAS